MGQAISVPLSPVTEFVIFIVLKSSILVVDNFEPYLFIQMRCSWANLLHALDARHAFDATIHVPSPCDEKPVEE